MVTLRRILLPVLAAIVLFTVAGIHRASRDTQLLKLDLAEIDDLRYGLLDVDVWVDHLLIVLGRQIDEFQETPVQREQVRQVLESTIREVITEVERTIRLDNEDRAFGAIRQLATDFVVDFDDLRDASGQYADVAIDRLDQPQNRERLKSYMRNQIAAFADSTFDRVDRSGFDAALARNGCPDRESCRATLNAEITSRSDALMRSALIAIGLVALMFAAAAWPRRDFGSIELASLLLGTFALLFGGLFTPMIDIEAEIARLDMVLVGQPITFENQVLFFQSKSITDVVDLLVRTGRIDLVLVGIAIGLFSVVFPTLKLLATIAYRYGARLRERAPVRFFALESGKWSMADVFVIAMFLAFLGFDGLTGNQLAALVSDAPSPGLETRNGTQLRAGFHLFAAFCLAGLILSGMVKRSPPAPLREGTTSPSGT